MISRKDLSKKESDFVNAAQEETVENIDLHSLVKPTKWPISNRNISPSMANGSTSLRKTLTIQLKEAEWNSVDRHTKALNISKNEWVRYAILKLMQEEQLHFFKNK